MLCYRQVFNARTLKLKHLKWINEFRYFYTNSNYAAQVSFKLSDIGEGIREVVVKEWFVNVGDKVSQFDQICEVQSDKASVTITSRYDGVIKKLYCKVDDIAFVGKPLVDIETEGDDGNQDIVIKTEVENESKVIETEEIPEMEINTNNSIHNEDNNENTILCIPSVRRLAKEHKLDLGNIIGSGKSGRILKEDVLKFLKPDQKNVSETITEDRVEPIKGFQKAMVKTMTDSLKIPHFVYSEVIKVTKLSQIRKDLKLLSDNPLKISFMPFVIKAISNALGRYPILNATLDSNCENVTYKSAHNIGIAMDTKMGLVVPVIKNVETLSIIEVNRELNRLITSGQTSSFSVQDLSGATFTISNIGVIGGTYLKPVIMPPQIAIIAIGASQKLPRFDAQNNVIAEEIINLSAAGDHRIIDGATMARFVQDFKTQIETPYLLFLNNH